VRAKKLRVAVTEAARFPINPMASGLQCHRRMRADREQILDEVMWRAGWADRNAAGTALDATLVALGERLTAPDAVMLAEALSPPLAEALHRLARHTAPEPKGSAPASPSSTPRRSVERWRTRSTLTRAPC
jgi:uncharacterized protein (DUF2267 family)